MQLVNESEMLAMLRNANTVCLVEPNYQSKYPPLGLMKISSYCKQHNVLVTNQEYSKIALFCITSLFTYDIGIVKQTIFDIRKRYPHAKVILGGVCASLMSTSFKDFAIYLFRGNSFKLDECVPDYSMDWGKQNPWNDFTFTFTSRGCPNACGYCAVWRIEPCIGLIDNWRAHLDVPKKFAMISDNNLSSTPDSHLFPILRYLKENKLPIVFDNGFDCKHMNSDVAKALGQLIFTQKGCRTAFDRIEEKILFKKSITMLIEAGVPAGQIMSYVLFNFNDNPIEAFYRMHLCRSLGISPYPQQYRPLSWRSREDLYIGKHWNETLLKAFRPYWVYPEIYRNYTFAEYLKSSRNEVKLTTAQRKKFAEIETEAHKC